MSKPRENLERKLNNMSHNIKCSVNKSNIVCHVREVMCLKVSFISYFVPFMVQTYIPKRSDTI